MKFISQIPFSAYGDKWKIMQRGIDPLIVGSDYKLECIYLKQTKPDLKFTKREHVIPAGIGGIEKLPSGYVSDAANEFFSSIELIALRKTFLAVNRENVGPGKRGTLNVKKVKSPSIRAELKHDIFY
ncbi:MAG: hypothetical protein PHW39_05090 [Syntrophomonadaceae bacterium]|nr:hypothetical protein [Syntrophomonadaceae bacterium]